MSVVPDERPCDLAPAREARTRNRHPWLRAWLLRPSLRCRRFVQLLPRRGAPRWTSLLLKLGGSFREVSRQTGWPNTIGRTLRPMKPLRELFKPCFGHLRVSRHLRRAQGSLMLTSTVMESISRCSYALHVARQASCWTGWIIRKTPILCQHCRLQLSPTVQTICWLLSVCTSTWDLHARCWCIRAPASLGPLGEPFVICQRLLTRVTHRT